MQYTRGRKQREKSRIKGRTRLVVGSFYPLHLIPIGAISGTGLLIVLMLMAISVVVPVLGRIVVRTPSAGLVVWRVRREWGVG